MTKPAAQDATKTTERPALKSIWTIYHVEWEFLTRIYGSVPTDPEVVAAWLKSRMPNVRPPGARSIQEINEEVLATIERGEEFDETACNILTFQRHGGCAVRAETIRAHLKDCSRQLSNQVIGHIKNERAFSTRVINGVYWDPTEYWIPILRPDGTPVTKHDGEVDKFVHPRSGVSALKRLEWIEPAMIRFRLKVLGAQGSKPSVSEDDLRICMEYGGTHGYGGERSADGGRYTFTLRQEG